MVEPRRTRIDGYAELKRLYFPNNSIVVPKRTTVVIIDDGEQGVEELILFLNTGKVPCKKDNSISR